MGLILTPDKFHKQPQYPAHIDWSNPITKALCFVTMGSAPAVDLVSGNVAPTWNGKRDVTIYGKSYKGLGDSTQRTLEFGFNPVVGSAGSGSGNVTLFVLANPIFEDRLSVLIGVIVDPQASPYQQVELIANCDGNAGSAAAGMTSIESYNSANQGYGNAVSTIDGNYHQFVGVYKSQPDVYVDGVLKTSANGKYTGNFGITANSRISVGSESGKTSTRIASCDIPLAMAWNRALSAKEIASLNANPWQIFKAPPRKWWVVSGTAVTIDSMFMSGWQSRFLNDRQIQTDFIAPQVIDKSIASEWGMGVLKDSTISSEILATTSRDSRSNSDWISSLMMDKQIALDSATSLLADERMVLESLSLMQKDSVFSVDHLANLLTDYPVPVEWSGSIQVITDSIAPIEWAAQLRADSVVPIEWQGGLQIHMDASVPMDWAAQVQADFQIPNEHVVAFLTDKQVTLDFASSVAASQNLSNCWMMIRHFDSSVPAEWQGLTSPFDIGVTHIFRVDSRGTVFAISPRDEDFSIAPRSTIFNIIN